MTSGDEREGLATALAEGMQNAEPPARDGQQLALLDDDTPPSDGWPQMGNLKRGPGRPPGSRNKRTEDWRRFLDSQYTSPLEWLSRQFTVSTEWLACELGVKPSEAFELQVKCAIAALPYREQKLPMAVDVTNKASLTLIIEEPKDADPAHDWSAASDDSMVIDIQLADGESDGKSTG